MAITNIDVAVEGLLLLSSSISSSSIATLPSSQIIATTTTRTDKDRKCLLKKYKKLVEKGMDREDAASSFGLTIRTFQNWNKEWGKTTINKRYKKSSIHDIEDDLILYINNKAEQGINPIKPRDIINKANSLCTEFNNRNYNSQKGIIYNFRMRRKDDLPLSPRVRKSGLYKIECGGIMDCTIDCSMGIQCPYKRLINNQYKNTIVITNTKKGSCLLVQEDCKAGDFIIEYKGKKKKVSKVEFDRKGGKDEYYLTLGKDNIIDGKYNNDIAKNINHSCMPNCELKIIYDAMKKPRACIIAIVDIKMGDELTFDYNWEKEDNVKTTPCLCREKNCRGTIEK